MSEWKPIENWRDCVQMARPGYVFEVRNSAGQSLFTDCGGPLAAPFGWSSAPVRFRLVPERPPVRSGPLPAPAPLK